MAVASVEDVAAVPVEDAGKKGESNPLELSYSNIPKTPTILNNNH